MVFYDTVKIYYQLNDKRSTSNLILKVDNNLWKGYEYVERSIEPHTVATPDSVVLKNRDLFNRFKLTEADRIKKTRMLEEVVVKGRARSAEQKMEELYTSGLFKGGDGFSFDLTNDPSAMGAMSLFAYLQGRVPGLQINNAMGGQPSMSWRGGTPDLFLNEMRSDVQSITSLSMADIAYVKVFRPPFIGAMGGGGGGAIAVYTKKGGATPVDFVGLSKVTISGYSPQRQFYSPDYAKSNPLHELDDVRTTLYWEPFIFLDGEKKKKIFTFYNNDLSKKLRITIEGVNEHGKLTRVEEFIR
jgi:hypothetical protein